MDINLIPESNILMLASADEIERTGNALRAQLTSVEERIADLIDIKTRLAAAIKGYDTAANALRMVADEKFLPAFESAPAILRGPPRTGPVQGQSDRDEFERAIDEAVNGCFIASGGK